MSSYDWDFYEVRTERTKLLTRDNIYFVLFLIGMFILIVLWVYLIGHIVSNVGYVLNGGF